jgi:hypothetical protein
MSEHPRAAAAELTPAAFIERLLSVTANLTDLVGEETALLEAREPLRIAELQARKTQLANDYAMDVQAVILNHGLIDRVPAERVARLKTAMTKLDEALRRNARILGAAKSVSEGILRTVAEAVNERKAPPAGYGRNAAATRPAPGQGAAIALDARF